MKRTNVDSRIFYTLMIVGAATLFALGSERALADTDTNVFIVYSDAGIPSPPADLFTWAESGCSPKYNGKFADPTAPEGSECFLTAGRSCSWIGWGVFKQMDMSGFADGEIRYFLKSTNSLEFELEDQQGRKVGVVVASTGGQWEEEVFPASQFAAWCDLSRMYGLFLITSKNGPATFYVDNVRWVSIPQGLPPPPEPLVVKTNGLCPAPPDEVVLLRVNQRYSFVAGTYAGYVFTNWTDGAQQVLTNGPKLMFVMQSNLVLVANYRDIVKPTLQITSPKQGQRLSDSVVTVHGGIKENGCVRQVLYQLNGGAWQAATTATTNWTATVGLVPGLNTLRAFAVDMAGNVSRTNSVSFTYVLNAPLVVEINGKGTVRPNYNGQLLEIGKTYRMRASPVVRYRFAGWTGSMTNNKPMLKFVMASNLTFIANFQAAKPVLVGLDFSPYMDGQAPSLGSEISVEQLRNRMLKLRSYSDWIRTYGCTHGLENAGQVAHELQFKAAVGAWLGTDTNANEIEISNLVHVARQGYVDLAIVGNETLLSGSLTETQIVDYLTRVKRELPDVPVTTADTYGEWLSHCSVMDAVDVVLVNYYPFWDGVALSNAVPTLHGWHKRMTNVARAKLVVVSETGWPSAGQQVGEAAPSPQNASFYFLNFLSWAHSNHVPYFYFEAFDESWKTNSEGPLGAHWGVWDKNGKRKPGMGSFFVGKVVPDNWSNREIPGGVGAPSLELTGIPAYGTFDNLEGQVQHVPWIDYAVVVYICVGGHWWVKPYSTSPLTPIDIDGRWVCDVTTGGVDEQATAIAVYVVPVDYTPPPLEGEASLPAELDSNSVARVIVSRNP
jgi:exo-beta-1,3-glucanase (GH17 family)